MHKDVDKVVTNMFAEIIDCSSGLYGAGKFCIVHQFDYIGLQAH